MKDPEAAEVKAAGGVVWRRSDGRIEICLVHRPRYDDWSPPKGKLDPGEGWEEAALREVEEEIGARCTLGAELTPIHYRDNKGRRKAVRYWLMELEEDGSFTPNDEVDAVRWLDLPAARQRLSYPHDAAVLDALERLDPT